MRRSLLPILLLAVACAVAWAAQPKPAAKPAPKPAAKPAPKPAAKPKAPAANATTPDDWRNPAWAFRKRVVVRLPDAKPIAWPYRAPKQAAADAVAAQAVIQCETKLVAGAQAEVRVVDAGGNVLPCVASGPDTRGLVRVTFPARRTIAGTLAAPIAEATTTVGLTVGRNKAVTPGMRFHVIVGFESTAVLEVQTVDATTSTARVVERIAPQAAKGAAVRSQMLTHATYAIYYGNPKAKPDGPTWQPPAAPVHRTTWNVTAGEVPRTAEALKQQMRANVAFVGASPLERLISRANPHSTNPQAYCIAAYESIVHCDMAGLYRFSLDTHGPSFLFLDGQLAAQRPGFFHQTGQWEHRGKVQLGRGYHHLVLFAAEGGKPRAQVTRLGWQPVHAKVYSAVPAAFFTARVQAEAAGLEARDNRQQAFFATSLAPRAILAADEQRYQFVQFHNHTHIQAPNELEQMTYLWDFGGDERSREANPGFLFPLPKGDAAPAFPVTLQAFVGGKLAGTYQRTVHCDPRPPQKLTLSLDIVSFANIVYDDERTSIAVRLRNATLSPVLLRAIGRLVSDKPNQIILRRLLRIEAESEDFCIFPIDMKKLDPKQATLELDFYLGSERVLQAGARIIPSPRDLATLRTQPDAPGALFDADGRRVMICAGIEDRDRHLEWVFYNYLRDDLLPRARSTRRHVLLFGDRMDNLAAPDTAFADYVGLLTKRLEADKRKLQFVPRATGLLPTLPDLVSFAKALAAAKPQPDLVVLSPGLADVAQASGVRDFARSIDVIIDTVRATGRRTKIVVVSPPPYPGNPRLSAYYTKAVEVLARDHHLPFLNLHTLLAEGRDDWVQAWYAAPDADGIFLRNPNEAAHKKIADALYKLIY